MTAGLPGVQSSFALSGQRIFSFWGESMRQPQRTATDEQPAGHRERWLITYADLITLLLIFFVVMYAMSTINMKKFRALAESLSQVMGSGLLSEVGPSLVTGTAGETLPVDLSPELTQLEQVRRALLSYITEHGLQGKVSVALEERGVVLSFQEAALFPLGSARLTPEAREIIRKVGLILLRVPNYIRVEGHTDDLPINTPAFPSNWDLSTARANTVVKELIGALDFPPERLAAVGYGEYRPRVPNDSDYHRQLNRRVDIIVLKTKYSGAEPAPLPPAVRGQNPSASP